jgi:superfamily I DNA/RNA helicase
MSFHKSKGLTAEVVVMAGLVEGLMPWAEDPEALASERETAMAEQRRLFYVGLTRTRRALVFSSAVEVPDRMGNKYRMPHRGWRNNNYLTIASRFMSELGRTLPRAIRGRMWSY